MTIDLNNLPDETLFLANDEFYEFVKTCLGSDEMLLFKIQCIKNVRALLNVPDVLAVINVKCKELTDIKDRICFIDENNNNQFVVKSGIKGGIDDLITALREKNTEYMKRTKRSKTSSRSSKTNQASTGTTLSVTSNLDCTNSTLTRTTTTSTPSASSIDLTSTPSANSIDLTSTPSASSIDLTSTPSLVTTVSNSNSSDSTLVPTTDTTTSSLCSIGSILTPATTTTASHSMSLNDYVDLISISIEKFSSSTFSNIILRNKHDYVICLTILDKDVNGYIKCSCNTSIKINYRSKTNSFQLSAYFKHVKNSRCFMMKKKKQELNTNSNETSDSLSISHHNDYDDDEDYDDDNNEDSEANQNDSFLIGISPSVSGNSYASGKKRSLPHSTRSSIKKKSRT